MIHHVGQPIVGDENGSAQDDSQRDIAAGQTSIVYLLRVSMNKFQLAWFTASSSEGPQSRPLLSLRIMSMCTSSGPR